MNSQKMRRLQAKGWKFGSAPDFLELSLEEEAIIEMKLSLSETVRRVRSKKHLTQATLARRLNSSQSRIAKVEAADSSVSLDLLVRAALAAGASRSEVARAIADPKKLAAV
jgi:DNA-binding XRE family transcriptional regulator